MTSHPFDDSKNILYLYDLPKSHYSSVKVAQLLKEKADIDLERIPQVKRDLTKPFFSAMVLIQDKEAFRRATQAMRYFEFEGKNCRALPFDNEILGTNSQKLISNNLFVRKIPKELSPKQLEEHFSQYGDIKSCKISLDEDHRSRGYGFVCFQNAECTKKALDITLEADTCQGIEYKPKDRRDMRKLFNNIYVKNLPIEYTEEQVKALFAPFGNISSIKLVKNETPEGLFAFVCFNSESEGDKEYGIKCAIAAVEQMNEHTVDGNKLYVKEALKKSERAAERQRETIKYKNSKKRCNLYVRNFPPDTNEEMLRQIFSEQGEIENLRMFGHPSEPNKNIYAFVCFKTPDVATRAKTALNNVNFRGRQLFINNYEIREVRNLHNEEAKDKRDFQQHRANITGTPLQWPQKFTNTEELLLLLQQILKYPRPMQQNRGPQQQNVRPNQYQNRGLGQQKYGQRDQRNVMQMGAPGMVNRSMPQPAMPKPVGMPTPQPNAQPGMMVQQQMPEVVMRYLSKTQTIINAINAENPYYKNTVGTAIFDFVVEIVGQEKAPKVTGMLIDLPIPEVVQIMQNYDLFKSRVTQADALLSGMP